MGTPAKFLQAPQSIHRTRQLSSATSASCLPPRVSHYSPLKHRRYTHPGVCRAVTLCIAAYSGSDIVLCFDRQIGDDASTSESAFKCFHPLGRFNLCALWAGNLDHVEDILGACIDYLGPQELTLENYKEEIWKAYNKGKKRLAKRGIKKTDVQLLVCGFVSRMPKIVFVSSDYVDTHPAFMAIGSGAQVADAMLRWRNPTEHTPIEEAIYYVYEAKRMGEMSPHVGKETHISVLSHEMGRCDLFTISGHCGFGLEV